MSFGWLALFGCVVYFLALLALAKFGGRPGGWLDGRRVRGMLYPLGCCVYGGSWTYYDSVDLASTRGLAFICIALGPVVLYGSCHRLLARIARFVRAQNITSIADFLGARYGKAAPVAAIVAVLAAVSLVVSLAFQIKVIAASLALVSGDPGTLGPGLTTTSGAGPLVVTLLVLGFALAVGTGRVDAMEHQRGLMLVVAAESVVKLAAFLVVGAYVTWGLFGGLGDLVSHAAADPPFAKTITSMPPLPLAVFMVMVGTMSTMIWPQQFHVTMVEYAGHRAARHAAWFVPLYYVLFGLFVLPLAMAGHAIFPDPSVNRDLTILALPLHGGARFVAFLGLIGGLSSSTGQMFVGLVTLSIMLSNDLVMPLLLRTSLFARRGGHEGFRGLILIIRRIAIVVALGLGYLCFRGLGDAQLITAVNLAVGCIMQIATVFVGGLFWRRATARGAMAGLVAGALAWAYTLLLPVLASYSGLLSDVVAQGPFGFGLLKPTGLFGMKMDPIAHGIAVGMIANITAFVIGSLTRPPNAIERRQSAMFIKAGTASRQSPAPAVTMAELEGTVEHYVGVDLSRQFFAAYRYENGLERDPAQIVDGPTLRFAEHLIASVVGAASSQLIIALLSRRHGLSSDEALRFVDQVSVETQGMRDFLQHAIGFAQQGMAVYDCNFRIIAWNQAAIDIFDIPKELVQIGTPLDTFLRFNAARGAYGCGPLEDLIAQRRAEALAGETRRVVSRKDGRIYEAHTVLMPDIGLFFIYSDITAQARSEEAREAENETLERRVRERTKELEHLNAALVSAKAEAEEANLSKTRFLAAASHDLLQPLNAARLYATCLAERMNERPGADDDTLALAVNVGASLAAVEDILTALLDMSRLDAGAAETEVAPFCLQDILEQLKTDSTPIANERGLRLTVMPSSVSIVSDRRLLRRLLQNLISNAIKYTVAGRVIVGVRRAGSNVRIEVWDTGIGIPKSKQREIFREFERLPSAARMAPGIGLGLSIVERLGRALGHELHLRSKPGCGSVFSVTVPKAQGLPIPPPLATERAAAPRHRSLDGLTVAAVDNDPIVLAALSALLEGWGCAVVTGLDFGDICGALKARTLAPDVIIADYNLDDGDGIAVVRALRARYGPCHAVLVTADSSLHVRTRAHGQTIRVLNKPVRAAALRALLSQWRMVKEEVD